jgi:hypothetical protein
MDYNFNEARLISPEKVSENSERVDYLFKMINEGFFTSEDVMEQIEISYKDKKEQKRYFIARCYSTLFRDRNHGWTDGCDNPQKCKGTNKSRAAIYYIYRWTGQYENFCISRRARPGR